MLDIKWIRENPDSARRGAGQARWSPEDARATVDDLIARDEARRAHLGQLQERQERRNAASKEIGKAMAPGDVAHGREAEGRGRRDQGLPRRAPRRWSASSTRRWTTRWPCIPNMPLDDVPVGADEHDNVEIRKVGEPRPRSN